MSDRTSISRQVSSRAQKDAAHMHEFAEWKICEQNTYKKQVDMDIQILDEEGELNTRNSSARYLLNIYAIYGEDGERIGYVLSFRPFSTMLRLMNKYQPQQLTFTFDKIIYTTCHNNIPIKRMAA